MGLAAVAALRGGPMVPTELEGVDERSSSEEVGGLREKEEVRLKNLG